MSDATNAEKAAHEHQHENTSLNELATKHNTTTTEIRAALNAQYPKRTSHLKTQVLEAYQDSSRTTKSILKEFAISRDTLNRWTLEHGLRRQPRGLKPNAKQQAALHDYADPSITITQAAEQHRVTAATLSRWAHRYGVQREQHENPKKLAFTHEYHRTRSELQPPSVYSLAKKHGLPESTARNWLKDQPTPPRAHPAALAQAQAISAYLNTSHPIRLIAKQHGVSVRTIWRYLEDTPAPAHRETRSRTRKPARPENPTT